MLIRPATVYDSEAIATVHVQTWQWAYRGLLSDRLLDSLSIDDFAERWRMRILDDRARYDVVTDDDMVVGFQSTLLQTLDGDAEDGVGEVGALYVHPHRWRRGVGLKLLEAGLWALWQRGCHRVTVWTFADSHDALRLYRRCGFVEDGAVDIVHGVTAVRLVCPLAVPVIVIADAAKSHR